MLDNFLIKRFLIYLRLEQSLSDNSVEAYMHDIELLMQYLGSINHSKLLKDINQENIENFLAHLYDLGLSANSQARILSGIKKFYAYLLQEKLVNENPTLLISSPSIGRHIPDVLSYEEICSLIDCIDLSLPFGHRNKAIIEIMYGCGLRVSEVTSLKISNIYVEDEFIRISAKATKNV